MENIEHWADGPPLQATRSPSGVLIFLDPLAPLIRTRIPVWPPPEIVQQTFKSNAATGFPQATRDAVEASLGRYTALQSINSEDALTWSVFGPLVYAPPAMRERFVAELFDALELPASDPSGAVVWLWRRVPHPQTWVSGGPEIDFGIQTRDTLVLGEAKWKSPEGIGQGVDGKATQLGLRDAYCGHDQVRGLYPDTRRFVVLGVSIDGTFSQLEGAESAGAPVLRRQRSWAALCAMNSHPVRDEVERYLAWKTRHSGERATRRG